MTLNDILRNAQDGRAVGNLAARFGLAPDRAEAATQAMIPVFSEALQRLKDNPDALAGLIAVLATDAHLASYAGPGAEPGAAQADAALQVFGSSDAIRQAAGQAARASGVAPETIEAMLPAVASILLGGMAHSMTSEGHGGALGDLASAASSPGGLSTALGSEGASGGGFMGMLGSIFGGSPEPANPQTAALVAGLAALSGMFVAGVVASQAAQQASLGAMASSFTQPPTGT